jgi:hypothetical protein
MPSASAQIRRVHLAPDDHAGYFWTANGADYRNEFVEAID